MNEKKLCSECIYFFSIKDIIDLSLGVCSNKNSDHSKHILAHSHLPCNFFIGQHVKDRVQKIDREVIIYGGTKKQIQKQMMCNHKWHGPCIDDKSRYFKCTECYCIKRDMTEKEYYKEIDLPEDH